jgi:predicted O-linked N-acetylglucosamine transferase (SPINDLY family)
LWLGVPVLGLIGDRFLSRAGLSVLSAAGMPEWMAETPDAFIQKAVALANDIPHLAAIRASMRDKLRASPLLDQVRFTRNLEQIYRDVWHKYVSSPSEHAVT